MSPDDRAAFVRRSWELFVSEVLQEALERRDLKNLSRLLAHYRRSINARDYDGSAVLHAAAQGGHIRAVQLLIDHDADVDAKTNLDETPLHFAARDAHLAVVKMLVARGANIRAKSRAGQTPLDETKRHKRSLESEDVAAFLQAASERQST